MSIELIKNAEDSLVGQVKAYGRDVTAIEQAIAAHVLPQPVRITRYPAASGKSFEFMKGTDLEAVSGWLNHRRLRYTVHSRLPAVAAWVEGAKPTGPEPKPAA